MARLERVKALPWAVLLQGGALAGKRWRTLSAKDRRRITDLIRRSRGVPGNLSVRERTELKRLIGKLDVKAAGRDLLSLLSARRKRRRR
jgi:hypothetical protein